jgi:hypothetical protein
VTDEINNPKGGQGGAPLGVPPPLGERGGHHHKLTKKPKNNGIILGFLQSRNSIRIRKNEPDNQITVKALIEYMMRR